MSYGERSKLYKKIEDFTDSKVVAYITGDRKGMETQIGADVLDHFVEHLDRIGMVKRISLILCSQGGNTLAGWSLVQLIKQFCEEFHVIIPSVARSTATLIALGADEILMTKQATLGPIDPSVNGPLNPEMLGAGNSSKVPVSVESINGFIDYAKDIGVSDTDNLGRLFAGLSEKVHPVVLGNVYRCRSQIRMLGGRLLREHLTDDEKIEEILSFLCSESGSHDYSIYRREARSMGLKVKKPNDHQYSLLKSLHDNYVQELELRVPFSVQTLVGTGTQSDYDVSRSLIESVEGGSVVFKSKGTVVRTTVQVNPTQQQNVYADTRTFEGWVEGASPSGGSKFASAEAQQKTAKKKVTTKKKSATKKKVTTKKESATKRKTTPKKKSATKKKTAK